MENHNLKNEVVIKGNDTEYTLRPTFGSLMAIEKGCKRSLIAVIQDFNNGLGSMADMVVILKEGSRAAGQAMSDNEIEDLIEKEGIIAVQLQLVEFFAKSLYGGKFNEAQKKIME